MSARSFFRGHPTILENGKWVYEDTGEIADFSNIRPCKKCGKTFDGSNIGKADPCLGEFPGVDNACCGHGVREQSYIRFTSGVVVKGFEVEYCGKLLNKNNGRCRNDKRGRN